MYVQTKVLNVGSIPPNAYNCTCPLPPLRGKLRRAAAVDDMWSNIGLLYWKLEDGFTTTDLQVDK